MRIQSQWPQSLISGCWYRLASCGGDRQIFYWDVATGKVIRKFRGHDGIVNSVRPPNSLFLTQSLTLLSRCCSLASCVIPMRSRPCHGLCLETERKIWALGVEWEGKGRGSGNVQDVSITRHALLSGRSCARKRLISLPIPPCHPQPCRHHPFHSSWGCP